MDTGEYALPYEAGEPDSGEEVGDNFALFGATTSMGAVGI